MLSPGLLDQLLDRHPQGQIWVQTAQGGSVVLWQLPFYFATQRQLLRQVGARWEKELTVDVPSEILS